MSTSLTSVLPSPTKSTAPRLLTPTTPAIPLLNTPTARAYAFIHAPLLLLYHIAHFRFLVANPLGIMAWDCGFLAIAQCAYCVLCLPPAGTWSSGGTAILEGSATSKSSKSGTGSVRGKKGLKQKSSSSSLSGRSDWKGKVSPAIFSLILTLTLPTLPLFMLAICLGAPLSPSRLLPHTFALATEVSILAFMPIFYSHGISKSAWYEVTAAWLLFDEAGAWGGTIGAFVGGWIGAVPMALDWDRDWQAWPVPVVTGVMLGYALGQILLGRVVCKGVRINMSEATEEPPRRTPVVEKEKAK